LKRSAEYSRPARVARRVANAYYRTGALFNNVVFSLYDAWNAPETNGLANGDPLDVTEARRAIARGETLFNTKPITIGGVKEERPRRFPRIAMIGSCRRAPRHRSRRPPGAAIR